MTDLDWLDDPPPAGNWRRDRPRTTDPTRHSTRRTTMTTTVRGLALLAAALVWALIMIAGIALIATPSRGDSCGILVDPTWDGGVLTEVTVTLTEVTGPGPGAIIVNYGGASLSYGANAADIDPVSGYPQWALAVGIPTDSVSVTRPADSPGATDCTVTINRPAGDDGNDLDWEPTAEAPDYAPPAYDGDSKPSPTPSPTVTRPAPATEPAPASRVLPTR